MNSDDVATFLRRNPGFFEEHPQLIESLTVPHPHGGRAIPLTERQVITLRDKLRAVETRMAELVRYGEDNDAIGEKVHRLSLALLGAADGAAAATALQFHLREDFAVPHVALRVWGPEGQGDTIEAALRDAASNMGAPQCGPAPGSPFLPLFGEAAEHLKSLALVPLGQTRVVGILALGSEDPQRFYPEMGTLYLRRIGELTAGALAAHA